jgi:osmotically inducible lipoprotein OsmB
LLILISSNGDRAMRQTLSLLAAAGAALALAACGHNMEQRAASGGVAGAVVGGPVGAVVGATAGAATSVVADPKH